MKLFNFEKKFFANDEASMGGSSDFMETELFPNDDIGEAPEDDIDFTKVVESFEEHPNEFDPVHIEEPIKEELPKDEEKTELQLLQEQNALLMERLNLLQNQINEGLPKAEPQKVEQSKPVEPVAPKATEGTVDIFDGQDFDDVLSDKGKFLGMLARYGHVVMQETYRTIASTLPNVVNEQVNYQARTKQMADEFYAANEDLAAVRPTVSAVMQTIISENPGKGMDEILTLTATKTRQILGLRPKTNVPPSSQTPPAAPNTGSKRVTNVARKMDVSEELEALKNLGF